MTRTIRARFSKGVFEPLEPTVDDLVNEGEEVMLTIDTGPTSTGDPVHDTAGGWRGPARRRRAQGGDLPGSTPGHAPAGEDVTARFLLDTDWIIDHFDGIAAITHRLEQLGPSGLTLSVISLAELYEGVHYARDPAASRRVLSRFVAG
jgi:predicted DNA-binding antitoxin AbrB/MazE fold protein